MTVSTESRAFVPPQYSPERLVGRGASSVVWEATQHSTGRSVALKVLDVDLTDPGNRRRFDRERQVMGALGGHPGIVTIFDAGTERGRPWIAMELCRRGSLASELGDHGPLAPTRALRVLAAVSAALGAVHAEGILHCDVKPANVLINDAGEPTLTDFGIARSGIGVSATTTTGGYTLDHVPPEVLEGVRPSTASDVYSLGTTIWQLLAARPPFRQGADIAPASVMRRILMEPLPDPAVADLPAGLLDLLTRMTAKAPADRPAAMADVLAQTRRILDQLDLDDGPTFPTADRAEPDNGHHPAAPTWRPADVGTRHRQAAPASAPIADAEEAFTRLRVGAGTAADALPRGRRAVFFVAAAMAAALVVAGLGSWGLGLVGGGSGPSGQAPVGQLPVPASDASAVEPPTPSAVAVAATRVVVVADAPGPRAGAVPLTGRATTPSLGARPVAAPQAQAPLAAPPAAVHGSVAVSSLVPVSAVDGGVDSGFAVQEGRRVKLTASGSVEYGYDGVIGDCAAGVALTDPDGHRTVGGLSCAIKHDPNVPMPSAPVGALIGRIGQGPWFLVGSARSMTATRSGELWLAHNDYSPSDNHGSYSVQVTVSG